MRLQDQMIVKFQNTKRSNVFPDYDPSILYLNRHGHCEEYKNFAMADNEIDVFTHMGFCVECAARFYRNWMN